jgi:crossover junction endodeoxyribonuclease RuvC
VMERTAYLSLDLGSACGWAVVIDGIGEIRPRTTSGTWDCHRAGHEDEAEQFMKFWSYLVETKARLDKMGVRLREVRFERVDFIPQQRTGPAAVHLWGAWWGLVLFWCRRNRIAHKGIPVATIKKRVTGSGKGSKDQVRQAVRARGFNPGTLDESDALAIAIIQERT